MTPAARVVPDVASFSVDDGFWYSIPEHLSGDLGMGTIVRVPLSGRRVRGWVVEVAESDRARLKDVAGISGAAPVFDASLLESLRWACRHYVSPLSGLLTRATPPNLPRAIPEPPPRPVNEDIAHPLGDVIRRSAELKNSPVTAYVSNWRHDTWLNALGPVLKAGRSVHVIVASAAEAEMLMARSTKIWGDITVGAHGEDDASDTNAWEAAQAPPRILIGTPRTEAWHVEGLALGIVVEENRRAMKDRQTPTLHVRDVMRTRSRVEGFNLVFIGPTPGVELLAAGAEVLSGATRPWALVEVVDRSEEAPGSGYLSERVVAAIKATADSGRKTFVFTHRRLGLASTRCARCRLLRTCSNCDKRLGRVDRCPRCETPTGPCARCGSVEFEEMGTVPERLVKEINRRAGAKMAAVHPGESPVTVGTERDLAGLDTVDLAIAADVDGMLTGYGYRTSEEALRQLARLATVVGSGRGSRLIVQTTHPDSMLITALRRADPIPYLERVLVERAREGAPPSSEMIAIELRHEIPDDAAVDLAELGSAAVVLGPMEVDDGQRWLMTGELGKARLGLRRIVGRWRDRGVTVRVDVDPIDV